MPTFQPCDPRVASAFLPSAPIQLKWRGFFSSTAKKGRAVFVRGGIKFRGEAETEEGLAGDGELTKNHSAPYVTCQSVFLQEAKRSEAAPTSNGFVLIRVVAGFGGYGALDALTAGHRPSGRATGEKQARRLTDPATPTFC